MPVRCDGRARSPERAHVGPSFEEAEEALTVHGREGARLEAGEGWGVAGGLLRLAGGWLPVSQALERGTACSGGAAALRR